MEVGKYKSAEFLSHLIRGMAEGVIFIDDQNVVRLCNPVGGSIRGVSVEEITGKNFLECHPKPTHEKVLQIIEHLKTDRKKELKRTVKIKGRFYEHTSLFELDTWSETRFPARLFLWLIVSTVSRHMNQLNFPVFGLETSRGMTSEILPLRDASGRAVYTGWQRRLAGSGFTIYAGFYSTVQPPGWPSPCVKVVFPLPEGNATAILHPEYNPQGHFRLISKGRRFGDPGFYRILELNSQQLKVRYLRSLHEEFDFYTDERGILRCDHIVRFLGMTMLRLHYRIRPKN